MDFRILGSLEVAKDGRNLTLGGTKQRSVLAVLLLHANEPVSVDRLVDEIWGEEPPPAAVQTVRVHVSRLRKSLAEGEANGGGASVLLTGPSGYSLQVGPGELDLDRFEHLLAEGRASLAEGDAGRARALLDEALTLWRGPPLADLAYEPFAQAEALRLEELRLGAIEDRIDADLALGHHAEVIPELERLVSDHPLRERLRAQQMLALYRSGRQAEALEAYLRARRALVDAVGAEPGPELRELHDAILRQDQALAPPSVALEPEQATEERRRPRWLAPATLALVAASVIVLLLAVTGGDGPRADIPENSVGLIDPDTGDVSAVVEVGRGPRQAVAGGGSVWIANALDGTVSRIDTRTRQVTTLDVGSTPSGLAFGEGSLWVATAESRSVSQIDPRTNRVVQTIEVGNAPGRVTVGFGSVWVAATVDGEVVQIDLDRGAVTRRIPVGVGPISLAAGAGSIWVAVEPSGTVEQIDPGAGRVVDAVDVGHGPSGISFGAGAVWVSNRLDGTLSRIDPGSTAVTETLRVGSAPSAVAADSQAVWVADNGDGVVSRIDPRRRRVAERIAVGSSPSALTIAAGSVWTATVGLPATHRGGTLRVFWERPDPRCHCVDPVEYFDLTPSMLAGLTHDGLVAYRRVGDAAGATLVPNLARELPQPTDGGRTYVFGLRPGLRYSNGRRVRPEDFRHSIERMLRLRGRPIPPYYSAIVGAPDCVRPTAPCDLSKGIETDARSGTITIHLVRPEPDFLHALTAPWASVLPSDSPMRLLRSPLPGTGPYRISSWSNTRGGRLERNPHFRVWSREARPDGFPDAIDIEFDDDARRQLASIDRGDADLMTIAGVFDSLSPEAMRRIQTRYPGRLIGAAQPEFDHMFLNARRPPFDDPRARRALDLAVDRRKLVEVAGGPTVAQLTCQFLPPGFPGYRPYCPQTLGATSAGTWSAPDLIRAQQLVTESGTRGAPVEVWAWRDREPIARYIASVLRGLGFRPNLHVFSDAGPFYEAMTSPGPRPDVGPNGWYPDYLAPSNIVEPNFSCEAAERDPPGTGSFSGFCDRTIDGLTERALEAQTRNPESANGLWRRVDRELVEAAPAIPMFNRRGAVLVSKRVENVEWHPLWGPLLDQIWVR